MSSHRTISELACPTVLRTASGHIDLHAYDARARAARAAAFKTAFAAVAGRLRAVVSATVRAPAPRRVRARHRDGTVGACC